MKFNIEGGGEGEEEDGCVLHCYLRNFGLERARFNAAKRKIIIKKKMVLVGSDSEILRKKIWKILFFFSF